MLFLGVWFLAMGGNMARKPTDSVQVKLRIPEGLRRMIAAEARKNKRSANQEIISRLADSLAKDEVPRLVDITVQVMETLAATAALDAVNLTFDRLGIKPATPTEKEGDK
jgi:hypothetical protein